MRDSFASPGHALAIGRRALIGGAAGLALAPRPLAAAPASGALADKLGTHLAKLAAEDDFTGTVLLAERGRILFHKAYGFAERGTGARNRTDTRFNLASIGKMFTATAIMQLVEAGKIAIGDRLIRYLPDYPNRAVAESVTIEQLLTHQSGLGNYEEGHSRAASVPLDRLADHLPLFAGKAPDFAPGTRFSYSNAGYVVLGLVIEAVTGADYYDHIRRTIFARLGMTGADFLELDMAAPRVATGYMRSLDRPGAWQSNILMMGRRGSPAGGSYAMAGDLHRFAEALVSHRLLGKATTEAMTQGRVDYAKGRYGYGVSEDVVNGHRIIGHSGGHYGIANELMIFEDLGIVAVILTNCDVDAYFDIANWLKRELVGESGATRAYWRTRAVVDIAIANGEAAGLAAARTRGEALREIVIDLAGLKALHRRQDATALALLSLNRALFPESSAALLSLASGYRVAGRSDAAKQAYAAYLAMEPDDTDARRALARLP